MKHFLGSHLACSHTQTHVPSAAHPFPSQAQFTLKKKTSAKKNSCSFAERKHTKHSTNRRDITMSDQNTTSLKEGANSENNTQGNDENDQEHSQRKRKANELSDIDRVVNESKRKRVFQAADEPRRPSFVQQKSIQVSIFFVIVYIYIQHVYCIL